MKNDKKEPKKKEEKSATANVVNSNEPTAEDAAKALEMLDEYGNVKEPAKKLEENKQKKLFEDDDGSFALLHSSFLRPFIYSFNYSFIHSFSFINSFIFIHSFIHLVIIHSFIYLFIQMLS